MAGVLASKTVRTVVLVIAGLVGATRLARAECKPAAIAQGDPALVKSLQSQLAASGIATTPTSGCPALRVRIEARGSQVHVQLADAAQRTGERDVQDIATAAAIVESWTYQEIDAGTLPAEPAAAVVIDAPALPAIPLPRRANRSGFSLSALSGIGTNGGTTWIGGSLAACVRLSSLCAGVALRGQLDTRATGETSMIAQHSYALASFATVDLPRKLGGFVVAPGIALGYSYLHVTTTHHDALNNPLDVLTPDHQLRAAAHASVLRPWGDRAAVFADLWSDAVFVRNASPAEGPGAAVTLSLGVRLEVP